MFLALKQEYSVFAADFTHFAGPYANLHFTDVCSAQHLHTKSGLTDTATDGQRQFAIEKALVIRQLTALIMVR